MNHNGKTNNSTSLRLLQQRGPQLILGVWLAACMGCWQEIQYDPTSDLAEAKDDVVESVDTDAEAAEEVTTGEATSNDPVVDSLDQLLADPAEPSVDDATEVTPTVPDDDETIEPERYDAAAPLPQTVPPLEAAASAVPEVEFEQPDATEDFSFLNDGSATTEQGVTPPTDPTPVDLPSFNIEEPTAVGEQFGSPSEAGDAPDLGFLSQPSSRERQAVWLAASRWSLSAAMFAKGADEAQWRRAVAGAQAAADEIALRLPPLPDDPQDRVEAVVRALSDAPDSLAEQIASAVHRRTNAAEAASARLAIRANLLLLTYSPQNGDAAQQADSIRALAQASSIPAEHWKPLVAALEAGVDFAAVKQAVFLFHRRVTASLKTQPASRTAETLLGDFLGNGE